MGYNKSNFTIEELHDEDLIIMETIMGSGDLAPAVARAPCRRGHR